MEAKRGQFFDIFWHFCSSQNCLGGFYDVYGFLECSICCRSSFDGFRNHLCFTWSFENLLEDEAEAEGDQRGQTHRRGFKIGSCNNVNKTLHHSKYSKRNPKTQNVSHSEPSKNSLTPRGTRAAGRFQALFGGKGPSEMRSRSSSPSGKSTSSEDPKPPGVGRYGRSAVRKENLARFSLVVFACFYVFIPVLWCVLRWV